MQILPRIIVLPLLFCLLGCEKENQAHQALEDGILILGNGAEPKALDPGLVQSVGDSNILTALFEGLVNYDPVSDVANQPGVAERWESADNYTRWTFFLRKNAKWSNGDPVTAHDFVYSYQRNLSPEYASPYASMLYFLQNAEEYSKWDLVYFLCGRDKSFPVSWDKLQELDLSASGNPEAKRFNQIGLNHLQLDQLKELKKDLSLFTWTEGFPKEAKIRVVNELIAFHESGVELWTLADVGVRAIDDFTLECRLRLPTEFFPGVVKHQTWYPVHKATVEKFGSMTQRFSPWQLPGNHVGNGAYKLKSWKINKHVQVIRNPEYWDAGNVGPNEVWFIPADTYTEERMFRDGLIHSTYVLPPSYIELYREQWPELLRTDPYLGTYFYRCNVNKPPMDDPLVRQALSLAIDRQAIVEEITQGGQEVTKGFCPPIQGAYEPPHLVEFNPEKARELLKQSKYATNFPKFELLINTSESHKAVAEAIQEMWRDNLGLGSDKVTINNQEWKVFQETVFSMKYEMCRAGWIADYVDPTTFLDMWRTGDSNNNTGWGSPDYDRLLKEAALEKTPEARMAKLNEAEKILLEAMPVIPIYHYSSVYAHHPGVQNWHPLVLKKHDYKNIKLVPSVRKNQ